MKDIRIIGVGSPFSNDDIGWRVIEHLQQRDGLSRHFDLITSDRPGVNLLHLLQDAQRVILVDALLAAERQGEILVLDHSQICASGKIYSSHDLDIASALQLASKLGMLPRQLAIVALAINPDNKQPVDDRIIEQIANVVCSELASMPAAVRPCYS